MQNQPRRYIKILIVSGYILFLVAAFLSYRWLVGKKVGMDSLIAYLLSQMFGILILYYMRRATRFADRRLFTSREYGRFQLLNAIVLLINVVLLSTLDVNALFGEMGMQIYGTSVTLCTNIVLHIVQEQRSIRFSDRRSSQDL